MKYLKIFPESDTNKTSLEEVDVMVVSHHPDDAEIFSGGLILSLVDRGYKVAIVDLTLGEMSSRGTVEERMFESRNAAELLKVSLRLNLEFKDSEIGTVERESQLKSLVGILRTLKPKLLISPYGDHRHPDHWRTKELVNEAIFFANLPKKFRNEGAPHSIASNILYMMRESFPPSFISDVTRFYSDKEKVIACYSSQVARTKEGHETLVSDPLSVSSIRARDAFYGSAVGVEFGEPFYTQTLLQVSDPFRFFMENGPSKSFIKIK